MILNYKYPFLFTIKDQPPFPSMNPISQNLNILSYNLNASRVVSEEPISFALLAKKASALY